MFDKYKRKKEAKRLLAIKEEFLKEYTELCKKYHAQLVPVVLPVAKQYLQITQRLDSYYEVKKAQTSSTPDPEKKDEKPKEEHPKK